MKITYRIMRLRRDEYKYGLFEYFIRENGVVAWTEVADLYGDDPGVMKLEVDLMQQAFELPILDYETGKEI